MSPSDEENAYGLFGSEHYKNLMRGLELFNNQQFWECHELLEDFWLEDVADRARYVYWAVIQVSNALFHFREKNMNGARGQMNKCIEKIYKCEQYKVETKLLFEKINWGEFKDQIKRYETLKKNNASDEQIIQYFNSLQLFQFRYN